MSAKRKDPGIDWVSDNLKKLGIPIVEYALKIKDNRVNDIVAIKDFILGDSNLLVIGEDNYLSVAKMMRLKYVYAPFYKLYWMSQSMIMNIKSIEELLGDLDTLALVELHQNDMSVVLEKLSSMVSLAIANSVQVIIGVDSGKILNEVFPFSLDTIQNNFTVIEI